METTEDLLPDKYETEAERLQREADEYTKKLEHERK